MLKYFCNLVGIFILCSAHFVTSLTDSTDCFNRLLRSSSIYEINNVTSVRSLHSNGTFCPPRPRRLQVFEDVRHDSRIQTLRDIYICWPENLQYGTLIFNGFIIDTKPVNGLMTTCRAHDSLVIHQQEDKLPLYVFLRTYSPASLEIRFSPLLLKGGHNSRSSELTKEENAEGKRLKRMSAENPAYTKESAITDTSECGNSRSCYRNGPKGCEHLRCNYFLSYKYLMDKKSVDIEISGQSDGWIAIGFSSDRTMGGDEIYACMYQRRNTLPIRALSFTNPHPHVRPEENHSFLVNHSESRNGFMYCRFEVPIKRVDSDVDLTNEWIQFYAKGSLSGMYLEKHEERPSMSTRLVSIVEHMNVINAAQQHLSFMPAIFVNLLILMV